MSIDPIAVVGMGAVSALGTGVAALWCGLLAAVRPFGRIKAFDAGACRVNMGAEVARPFPRFGSCRSIDFGVVAAREALTEADCNVEQQRVGLVVGSTAMGDRALEQAVRGGHSERQLCDLSNKGLLADELCAALNIRGPRLVVNTACSSGAVAIAMVCQGLQAGDFEIGVAIGCDEMSRITYSGFHALRALDSEPCRPFDKHRRGMTLGEGAGCLVMQRLCDAKRQGRSVMATLAGYGISCDAHHLTAPDPEGRGAALAIGRALACAGIAPCDLAFINAHGTGTPLNDAAEVAALERALGKHAKCCPLHSVKATTGHCLGAAGALEAVVSVISLRQCVVPATAGVFECEYDGRIDCIKSTPRTVDARFALSNSFGFGGNNAALVFAALGVRT